MRKLLYILVVFSMTLFLSCSLIIPSPPAGLISYNTAQNELDKYQNEIINDLCSPHPIDIPVFGEIDINTFIQYSEYIKAYEKVINHSSNNTIGSLTKMRIYLSKSLTPNSTYSDYKMFLVPVVYASGLEHNIVSITSNTGPNKSTAELTDDFFKNNTLTPLIFNDNSNNSASSNDIILNEIWMRPPPY